MILRIEDTDQNRFVPGAEQYILDSLAWAGIKIDEGVGPGGPHAPYRQSERKPLYQVYAKKLLAEGNAYYAFDTSEELEALRKASPAFQYDSATRIKLKNSLTMDAEDVNQRIASGRQYVIRMKIPANEEVRLNDLIRGEVVFNSSQVDDKVLMKSDGMPTYHLANVVDDHLMEITHVIRGEEWLPSAPLHALLYDYLGWKTSMPQFAHLPLLLKPDGNGKLSKRDADKMGFPIFPLTWNDPATGETAKGYRESGYLPEAIVNFLAFLGWNPGTTQEIFSIDQLVDAFTLERIGKAGAKFDILKAQWFNQQYLKAKHDSQLVEMLRESLAREGVTCDDAKAQHIVALMKERVTFPADFWEQGKFFFVKPTSYDEQLVGKKWNADAEKFFTALARLIRDNKPVQDSDFKDLVEATAATVGVKPGQMMQMLRITVTGLTGGPDLMATMSILGAAETAERLEAAIIRFAKKA